MRAFVVICLALGAAAASAERNFYPEIRRLAQLPEPTLTQTATPLPTPSPAPTQEATSAATPAASAAPSNLPIIVTPPQPELPPAETKAEQDLWSDVRFTIRIDGLDIEQVTDPVTLQYIRDAIYDLVQSTTLLNITKEDIIVLSAQNGKFAIVSDAPNTVARRLQADRPVSVLRYAIRIHAPKGGEEALDLSFVFANVEPEYFATTLQQVCVALQLDPATVTLDIDDSSIVSVPVFGNNAVFDNGNDKNRVALAVGLVVGICGGIVLCCVFYMVARRWRRKEEEVAAMDNDDTLKDGAPIVVVDSAEENVKANAAEPVATGEIVPMAAAGSVEAGGATAVITESKVDENPRSNVSGTNV